jgi:hypothetical protein
MAYGIGPGILVSTKLLSPTWYEKVEDLHISLLQDDDRPAPIDLDIQSPSSQEIRPNYTSPEVDKQPQDDYGRRRYARAGCQCHELDKKMLFASFSPCRQHNRQWRKTLMACPFEVVIMDWITHFCTHIQTLSAGLLLQTMQPSWPRSFVEKWTSQP